MSGVYDSCFILHFHKEKERVEIIYTIQFVDKSQKTRKKQQINIFVLSSREGGFCHFETLKMSVDNCIL